MNIGGLLLSAFNPANVIAMAMGPAGLAAMVTRQMGAQIAMNVIQQIGERAGWPQPMIDLAQGVLAQNVGMPGLARQNLSEAVQGFTQDFNLSPRQSADLFRTANDAVNRFVSSLSEGDDLRAARSGGRQAGGSWLMALASVMGDKLNAKARQVQDLAGQITDKTPDKTAKFGAASQEFGIMMNATNNAIKSLGEGLSTMARKS